MAVHHILRDGVMLVTIDAPPVNALSQLERAGLIDAITAAGRSPAIAIVIRGANASFVAGADVREFGSPPRAPHLPDVIAAIEQCALPTIAAIDGQALGGGLEIALGCDFRVASRTARLGLPEATLGLVPGAGGTQRLPRLIDPLEAATMISTGKPISAVKAQELGLVDRLVDDELTGAAVAFAREQATAPAGKRRLADRHVPDNPAQVARLDRMIAAARKLSRGAEAPIAALELVRTALTTPFEQGMALERETFLRLRASDQAAALRHIFFAERAAAKPPADVEGARPRPVGSVGVIGAGTMGTGIAMSVADAGLPVTVVELSQAAIDRGLARIAQTYRASAERGRLSAEAAQQRIALITGSTRYEDLAHSDLIIEAAFEAMDVKRDIFARLDAVARVGTILASNTSYLDLDAIAAGSGRAGDVVGLHYFSPANVMRLLEVVRGAQTAPDVLATALAFARRTNKVPVVAGVCNGFIGNRMLRAYVREAGLLLLEGATPEQVDHALTEFGMAMGPFAVADLSGIDIGYQARQAMPAGSYEPLAVAVHDGLVEAGHLGQKSGSGFYIHDPVAKSRTPNDVALELLGQTRLRAGVSPREIAADEIVERCLLALANEGGFILDEGIAARSGDIDVVYVNGYGFPRHRGGPMYYAQQLGIDRVRARLAALGTGRFGHWWTPAPMFGEGGQATG